MNAAVAAVAYVTSARGPPRRQVALAGRAGSRGAADEQDPTSALLGGVHLIDTGGLAINSRFSGGCTKTSKFAGRRCRPLPRAPGAAEPAPGPGRRGPVLVPLWSAQAAEGSGLFDLLWSSEARCGRRRYEPAWAGSTPGPTRPGGLGRASR